MFAFNQSSSVPSNNDAHHHHHHSDKEDEEVSTMASMTSETEEEVEVEETAIVSNNNTNKRQRLSTMGEYSATTTGMVHYSMPSPHSPVQQSMAATFMTPDRDRLTPPLPTFEELAKQLCKIVDTDHYSREEAKRTLVYLYRWGYTDVAQFLSDFSELGGIQRVLIFLKHNHEDPACVMVAAKVIMAFTHRPCTHPNYHIANGITKYLTMRDGIRILLEAGNNYTNKSSSKSGNAVVGNNRNDADLHALRWIWMSLMNITEKESTFALVDKNQLLGIFDSFFQTLKKLGSNVDNYQYDAAKKKKNGQITKHENTTTATATVTSTNTNTKVSDNSSLIDDDVVRPSEVGSSSSDFLHRAFSSFYSPGGTSRRKRTATEMITRPILSSKMTTTALGNTKATKTSHGNDNEGEEAIDPTTAELTLLVLDDMFLTVLNITLNNTTMTRADFHGTELLQKCIAVMKHPTTGAWIKNKELFLHASCFFVQCAKKDLLSTVDEYALVFPLIVQCITDYPEESYTMGLYDLVRRAYSVSVEEEEDDDDDTAAAYDQQRSSSFLQGSGIFGAIAKSWESKTVNEETKAASHQLLKELL